MTSSAPAPRSATVVRRTAETAVTLKLDLDGLAPALAVSTGCGFLDHLLTAMAKHAGFSLAVDASGDQASTGGHHLAEDAGLALGEALRFCLYGQGPMPTGESAPAVRRFGHAVVPMDDALVLAAVDLSGRPGAYLSGLADDKRDLDAAGFDAADWAEFARGLASAGMLTLHLQVHAGENAHHILEAAAKAVGRALGDACRTAEAGSPTSTKGRVQLEVSRWR